MKTNLSSVLLSLLFATSVVERHLAWKKKYPDTGPARGMPYSGIESLRPETIKMREDWLTWKREIGAME